MYITAGTTSATIFIAFSEGFFFCNRFAIVQRAVASIYMFVPFRYIYVAMVTT